MNKEKFNIYHWEFYIDYKDDDYTVYVYETRYCDVIGHLTNTKSLEEIENELDGMSEDEVYNWIDNNIEYL